MASTSTLVDRVKIVVQSSGTGPFQLGRAVKAYRGVEALQDGATYSYAIESGAQYEAGTGVYISASSTLVRTPQISSNGGAAVSFPANVELAFTALAQDIVATGASLPIIDSLGNDSQSAASQRATTQAAAARPTYLELADTDGASFLGYRLARVGAQAWDVSKKLDTFVSPMDFGAVGDGVEDDGDAINAMLEYARQTIDANPFASVCLYGGNRKYRTTKSLNATGISAWSLNICDLFVVGECVDKAVLDLIATRGYVLNNVSIIGDRNNMPACGIQAQRGTPGGFCDNATIRDINIDGYFSRAAYHDYGQETTMWDHATVFNRHPGGRVAIFEGFNGSAPMTSDYAPVMTGGTSFINKQLNNCDFRYLPEPGVNAFTVTAVTIGTNAVITAPGHNFNVGEVVVLQYLGGLINGANRFRATVTAKTTNMIMTNGNTTGYGSFTGGGSVIRAAINSPVYIARTEGFAMHDCYVVSYGQPPVELAFPDPAFPRLEQIELSKILFEGAGHDACVALRPIAASSVQGFKLTTFNTHSTGSFFKNLNEDFSISLFAPEIQSVDNLYDQPLVNAPATWAAYDAKILFSTLANVAPETWGGFNGSVTTLQDGKNTLIVGNELRLNGQRTRIQGSFSTGSAVPLLGSNKPGTSSEPATWIDLMIDGTAYVIPVWVKS